jgi:hypothetical protein
MVSLPRHSSLLLLLLLGLTSCTPTPPPAPPAAISTAPVSPAAPANSVPVNVYHMDDRCEKLVKQTENLPKDKTLETAIGSILNRANTADFTITDYRVTTQGKIATIVLRLPIGAKRSFKSMSSCEQMAYFGAMRETIVQRKEWNLQDVKFTDGKKEIQF